MSYKEKITHKELERIIDKYKEGDANPAVKDALKDIKQIVKGNKELL